MYRVRRRVDRYNMPDPAWWHSGRSGWHTMLYRSEAPVNMSPTHPNLGQDAGRCT